MTVLGTPTSCGNAFGWLSGQDKGPGISVCAAQLHNASVEGVLALLLGVALLVGWIVLLGGGQWLVVTLLAVVVLFAGAAFEEPLAGLAFAVAVVGAYIAYRLTINRRENS